MDLIKRFILLLLRIYQLIVSPLFGNCCRFYPSCSQYSIEVIQKYGVIKGSLRTLKRLIKCNPWHPGGPDLP
ncbi:MAG: membrane protein insertion efficiency factor YidD [Chlamydiota bacterium]